MAYALFGGTFNPIHYGHLALAREIQYRCHLEKIIFVPAGSPPHKPVKHLIDGLYRLEMVRLAIERYTTFSVTDFEVAKRSTCYSIDTVSYFRQKEGPDAALFFAMGLDAFEELDTWKDYGLLLDTCNLLITSRRRAPLSFFREKSPLSVDEGNIFCASEGEILNYDWKPFGQIIFMQIPVLDISSSDIRSRLEKKHPIDHLCPRTTVDYIHQQNLYRRDLNAL